MFRNKEKLELIFEINAHKGEPLCKSIVKLLELLINEVRVMNDTAGDVEYRINQGEIRGYSRILDYIEKGLPKTQ